MLQTQAINPELFRLLRELMSIPELSELYLVGGTSLALQLGHRESIDIDLFGSINFEYDHLSGILESLGEVKVLSRSKHINILSINGIKIDFVNYRYPWIDECIRIDNIRMASKTDIAAMKLNAITGRGSKKDFIDIYYLLKEYTMDQMFSFYEEKFDDGNIFLVQKSLVYFVDADRQPTPKLFDNITWKQIKPEILKNLK